MEGRLEEVEKEVAEMKRKEAKMKIEMDTLRKQNDYKVFLADQVEKDKKHLEKDKQKVTNELENLRKINSIVETLAKVENKAQWANSIRQTQPLEEQAQLFYETYRIQLAKEEEWKDKIEGLKTSKKELERKVMLSDISLQDKRKQCEKLKAQLQKSQHSQNADSQRVSKTTHLFSQAAKLSQNSKGEEKEF